MAPPIRAVAFASKPGSGEALGLARDLADFVQSQGRKLLFEGGLAEQLGGTPASPPEKIRKADLCIVIGGDGTLIHAVRLLGGAPVPVFGVNAGGFLGFLTEITPAEAIPLLHRVLAGDFQAEPRMKLRVRLRRAGQLLEETDVLNDAVINRGALARMVDLRTSIDGTSVTSFRADGVIVATPTGSTAYSLAAQGPILYPTMEAVVLNPICPHTLTQRPLVVPDRSRMTFEVVDAEGDLMLSLDGHARHQLLVGDRVEVERSPDRALLVKNPNRDFFQILRAKLHWGER
jgi:NAD+ kinase